VILIPGIWQSLQMALAEPTAAAACLAGYLCGLRGRWTWVGVAFAVAMLVRGTSAIVIICLSDLRPLSGRKRGAITAP
jgi:Mn2+/Fe2+ NRAMP family transporter